MYHGKQIGVLPTEENGFSCSLKLRSSGLDINSPSAYWNISQFFNDSSKDCSITSDVEVADITDIIPSAVLSSGSDTSEISGPNYQLCLVDCHSRKYTKQMLPCGMCCDWFHCDCVCEDPKIVGSWTCLSCRCTKDNLFHLRTDVETIEQALSLPINATTGTLPAQQTMLLLEMEKLSQEAAFLHISILTLHNNELMSLHKI